MVAFFLMGFRKRRFESFCGVVEAAVSHGLGPNLAAFEAFAGGTPRPDFETLLRQAL